MRRGSIIIIVLGLINSISSCSSATNVDNSEFEIGIEPDSSLLVGDYLFVNKLNFGEKIPSTETKPFIKRRVCEWDLYLQSEGLVNIHNIDSTILVDLKYTTEDNFMHKDMYGCLENCYLQPDVAIRLMLCQEYLKKKDSTLTLLIYDGVRPRSVQQYMWDILDMPINEKTKFVSNPKRGSLHNFGAAIDITLANAETQVALDMGAEYDQIGIISWPIKEKIMLDSALLTIKQVDNRKLLRRSMRAGKFFNIQTEWWHFNACYRDSAYVKYHIIEGLSINDTILNPSE